jgi:VWFA-related protein
VFLATLSVGLSAQSSQSPSQSQRPQFRAGVEVMRVEAVVLDKRTRKPIRGLTADDFVIKVNGVRQPIVAFSETVIPGADRSTADWTREASHDRVTNTPLPTGAEGRLIVIVMDDALTASHAAGAVDLTGLLGKHGTDLYHREIGRKAAHRIVDELGPYDRAAIVFPQFNQHGQDFTADRALLRRAIDTYNPQPLHGWLAQKMSLGTLAKAGGFLAGIPDHRRAIFYLTVGPHLQDEDPLDWRSDVMQQLDVAATEDEAALLGGIQRVVGTSRVASVPVYPISTRGLEAPTVGEIQRGSPARSRFANETLLTIAGASGGRAIYNNNAPDAVVADVFNELSSSYLIAYEATFPMDGKLRRLSVDVNHPNAVVAPDGLVLSTPKAATSTGPVAPASARPSGLLAAIAAPLAAGNLPLSLVAAPFASAGAGDPVVAITLGVDVPGDSDATSMDVELRVFDGEGRRQLVEERRSVGVRGPEYQEMALRTQLKSGRYNIRVAVELAGTELSGGVFSTVVVPEFARAPLSLSGIAIGVAARPPVASRAELAGVLPFAPSAERTFAARDAVGALLRIHQPATNAGDVIVDAQIVDAMDRVVSMRVTPYAAALFSASGFVEHREELALRELKPGSYVLTFTATAGSTTTSRDVRFSVR